MTVAQLQEVETIRTKVKRIGTWAALRNARNRGVPFEVTYYAMFNRFPNR